MKAQYAEITAKHLKNYDFMDNRRCPIARALRAAGFKSPTLAVGGFSFKYKGEEFGFTPEMEKITNDLIDRTAVPVRFRIPNEAVKLLRRGKS